MEGVFKFMSSLTKARPPVVVAPPPPLVPLLPVAVAIFFVMLSLFTAGWFKWRLRNKMPKEAAHRPNDPKHVVFDRIRTELGSSGVREQDLVEEDEEELLRCAEHLHEDLDDEDFDEDSDAFRGAGDEEDEDAENDEAEEVEEHRSEADMGTVLMEDGRKDDDVYDGQQANQMDAVASAARQRFTLVEDEKILRLRRTGLSWSEVAAQMPGRTAASLQARFRSRLKPVARTGLTVAAYSAFEFVDESNDRAAWSHAARRTVLSLARTQNAVSEKQRQGANRAVQQASSRRKQSSPLTARSKTTAEPFTPAGSRIMSETARKRPQASPHRGALRFAEPDVTGADVGK